MKNIRENKLQTQYVLEKIEEFKQRGCKVVKTDLIESWSKLVSSIPETGMIYYNLAIVEAALKCMELLNNGETIEESYKPIDVQDTKNPPIHLNMVLSGWQNNTATTIIAAYHEKGQEFLNYRNTYVNN